MGDNGLLFKPNDAEDLGRCLRRLVDEPGLLDQLRPHATDHVTDLAADLATGPASDPEFVWRDAHAYAQDMERTYTSLMRALGWQSVPAPQPLAAVSGPAAAPEPDMQDLPDLPDEPDEPDMQDLQDLPGLLDLQDLPDGPDLPDLLDLPDGPEICWICRMGRICRMGPRRC